MAPRRGGTEQPSVRPRRNKSIDLAVGANLKRYREAAEISRAELGQRLGVSTQQIFKYETGASRIVPDRLVQLAIILNLSVATLLEGVEGQQSVDNSILDRTKRNRERQREDLMATFDQLRSDEGRELVAIITKWLVSLQ